jgi:inositol-1,3,4-trisphosphate 5/6-kinase/inositol-tetrakisphosphate 1-kinase
MEQGKKIQNDRMPPPFLSSFPAVSSSSSASTSSKISVAVTTEEVEPVVNALKQAFGLDLFGFDILITSSESSQVQEGGVDSDEIDQCPKRQMLVVDVNYFPSYKEVSNFPSLLAQYLTQRAVDSRRQQQQQQHRPMYQKHG